MSDDEINKFMGWPPYHTDNSPDSLVMRVRHLVAKAVAAEREACAKSVEDMEHGNVRTCAAAIRARGQA